MSASLATPRSARRRFRTTLLLPLVPLALVLAACGGDDASSTPGAATGSAGASTGPSEPAAESAELTDTAEVEDAATPADSSAPQIGNGLQVLEGEVTDEEMAGALDALEALGIETRVGIIADALDATYEITSDSTASIFVDGDANIDGIMACFTVGFLSSPGDVLTVVYPNGDVVCD